jgi:hypothetical protein
MCDQTFLCLLGRRYLKELGCGRSQQLPIDPKILAISIEAPNSDKINK